MPKTIDWRGAPKFTIEPERARKARSMGVEKGPTVVEMYEEYYRSNQVRHINGKYGKGPKGARKE